MLMEFLYGMRRQCKDAEWSPSAVRLALIVEVSAEPRMLGAVIVHHASKLIHRY